MKTKNTETMYRYMNHDSWPDKPIFDAYMLEEYNQQFGTNYASIEEAISDDPEYLFTEAEMIEFCFFSEFLSQDDDSLLF